MTHLGACTDGRKEKQSAPDMVRQQTLRRAGHFCPTARALQAVGAALLICASVAGLCGSAKAAVVIMYHRFGESAYPSTNIQLDQFEAHIRALRDGSYNVVPLDTIVAAFVRGEALPDRTVGISIDDAYLSAYREAAPRLLAAGLPWTLFVATEPVERSQSGYMTWEQIRELERSGVTIGSQTESHPHMADNATDENAIELQRSKEQFTAQLGKPPTLFAYPYGEASLAVMKTVSDAKFLAAFGQHSGAIGMSAERFYLPRFAMNEAFGDISRFRIAINALPIEVSGVTPPDPLLTENPPPMGFTLQEPLPNIEQLACYTAHDGRAAIEELGGVRVEIRLTTPFPRGWGRINCTVPAAGGRWFWYGRQFYIR
jgi:poly-beta-1,6-N-acetyl-D-glucosamine N-deacetylase